jgi:hypothetical protein
LDSDVDFGPPARRPARQITFARLAIVALMTTLVALLSLKGLIPLPDGGKYPRQDFDHGDLMVSDAPNANRTLTIMFVGNSLTFVNDLPAMLVNIASSDPGAPVRLQVKAFTISGATLWGLLNRTDALSWAQAHRADYVVLQEHSHWYDTEDGLHASPYAYEATLWGAQKWADALKLIGTNPVLLQVWGEADGGRNFTDHDAAEFGSTAAQDAANALRSSERLSSRVGAPLVLVGQAFETARLTPGAPDVRGPDGLHPSVAGTYLAALVIYRYFTGRTGLEATYRPFGLGADDAAKLQRIAAS